MQGVKYDEDKPRWELLPVEPIEQVVKVLSHGARKYDDDNWRRVERRKERYYAAAMRHIVAWRQGERDDPETNLHHLAHAMCCLVFLMEEDKNG